MFGPTHYLAWARRFYGQVRFDLASSGMTTVALDELAPAPLPADDPSGWPRLREAIATYHAVPSDEVCPALGTTHALWLAYASLTCPGDGVLVEEPGYEPLVRIAEGLGLRVHRFRREPSERYALDPDRVARALVSGTRVIAVSNLHNPSGVRADDAALAAIARVAEARGAHLLVDEVYAPFDAFVDSAGVFSRSARKLGPAVVAVSSLTKCYGLGPERVGWVLASSDVIARADDAITASCGSLPLSHAHLGLRAFATVRALAERAKRLLAGKRELVATWMGAMGLDWSHPQEGLFGLALVPGAPDLTSFIEKTARDREVLVAPGSFFGVPGGFRLSWSAPTTALQEGLVRLSEALHEVAR